VFDDLLQINSKRGDAAISLMRTYRDTQSIEKWIGNKFSQEEWQRCINGPGCVLLGHVRAPTGGASLEDHNNHPFHIGTLFMAHNGIILNHDDLCDRYNISKQVVETDSYAMLAAIAANVNHAQDLSTYLTDLADVLSKQIKGSFACWLYSAKFDTVSIFRVISSLYYSCIPHARLDFSSESLGALSFCDSQLLEEGVILTMRMDTGAIIKTGFSYYSPYHIEESHGNT
jgi:glutamine phosphoribosylpyrophosphate amidotransferase